MHTQNDNIMEYNKFVINEDYYLQDGRVIFTEKYLKNKKSCCGGTCEHCPYTERFKNNKNLKK